MSNSHLKFGKAFFSFILWLLNCAIYLLAFGENQLLTG